ncbi:hypothetical protein TBLA_0G01420 [Henningerozyma blattae CBS 6284]|uniref:Uncharacterized protein n=1 Tax=Henningerozyma blattae (strain ATCC 34711 / CBS 6284 / DSM 70876 / NBRC 10599 / NRRL Y-10934 / UCD 77-7) TaxID=1071380 RepID=I2H6T6_HENB6|nr:hypothetical protein TBLA_0G01420 [Tetrapisispora blattae CBS 6284]CCH62088.1 hypothetical protein TBLA_0G01420 [Tetrapisispora blattae CBS 6284]
MSTGVTDEEPLHLSVIEDSDVESDELKIIYIPEEDEPSLLCTSFLDEHHVSSYLDTSNRHLGNVITSNTTRHESTSSIEVVDSLGSGNVLKSKSNTFPHENYYERSFRKRSAIQKMPYSLDRIKHRQLMNGYDVTNFEAAAENVALPDKPINANEQERIIEDLPYENPDSNSYDVHYRPEEEDYDDSYFNYSDANKSLVEMDAEEENNDFLKIASPIYQKVDEDKLQNQSETLQERYSETDLLYQQNNFHSSSDIEKNSQNEMDNSHKSNDDNVTDEFKFRGKMLNVKTGFRGVLPRFMWEKNLKKSVSRKSCKNNEINTDKKSSNSDRKGIALRKKSKNTISNRVDDKQLLDDMIAPEDETNAKNFYTDDTRINSKRNLDEETLGEYFNSKYQNEYSWDDLISVEYISDDSIEESVKASPILLDVEKGTTMLPKIISSEETLEHAKRIITPTKKTNCIPHGNSSSKQANELINLNKYLGDAQEYNNSSVDYMLSESPRTLSNFNANTPATKYSTTSIPNKRKNINFSNKKTEGRTSVKLVTSKRSERILRKLTQKKSYKPTRQPIHSISQFPKADVMESLNSYQIPGSLSSTTTHIFKKRKTKNKSKDKNSWFGLFPNSDNEISRHANTFTTIVESVSNTYAPINTKLSNLDNNVASTISEKLISNEEHSHSILTAIQPRQNFKPPDIITVKLPSFECKLSRFDIVNIPKELKFLFDQIIDREVPDLELLKLNKQLVNFIYQLDIPQLFDIIESFHKSYRSKVSQLKEKAKAIHFYQIAICQVLLLEISRFSNTSNKLRAEIYLKILDHIVSFFNLLNQCIRFLSSSNTKLLTESYSILQDIIQTTDMSRQFWKRLQDLQFEPNIAIIIVNLFPSADPKWSILKILSKYDVLINAFQFIQVVQLKFDWKISTEIIISLDKIFKKRRYENFEEEKIYLDSNYVLESPTAILFDQLLFNRYLELLRHVKLSDIMIERLVPMSKIKNSDTLPILKNRINLLIILAGLSNLNLERRFKEQMSPLISESYLNTLTDSLSSCILDCILKGVLAITENNMAKQLSCDNKLLLQLFQTAKFHTLSAKPLWKEFYGKLALTLNSVSKSIPIYLRHFFPYLQLMIENDSYLESVVVISKLYVRNMTNLGPSWVLNHIFKLITSNVSKSKSFINDYCTIGNFIGKSGEISWWSLFTFNGLEEGSSDKIYFFTKLLEIADNQSFDLIKEHLLRVTVDNIIKKDDVWFKSFVIKLLSRCKHTSLNKYNVLESYDIFSLLRSLFSILATFKYYELGNQLISNLLTYYELQLVTKSFATSIINFLNVKYIDFIKSSHAFSTFKVELGISNIETEKSEFRDSFISCIDVNKKIEFIETGLIHSCLSSENFQIFSGKFQALFNSENSVRTFKFLPVLFNAHLSVTSDTLLKFKVTMMTFILNNVNQVIQKRYGQISEQEFPGLHELFKLQPSVWKLFDGSILLDVGFYREYTEFESSVLEISQGFTEYFELKAISTAIENVHKEDICTGNGRAEFTIQNSSSCTLVDDILQKTLSLFIDPSFLSPTVAFKQQLNADTEDIIYIS